MEIMKKELKVALALYAMTFFLNSWFSKILLIFKRLYSLNVLEFAKLRVSGLFGRPKYVEMGLKLVLNTIKSKELDIGQKTYVTYVENKKWYCSKLTQKSAKKIRFLATFSHRDQTVDLWKILLSAFL